MSKLDQYAKGTVERGAVAVGESASSIHNNIETMLELQARVLSEPLFHQDKLLEIAMISLDILELLQQSMVEPEGIRQDANAAPIIEALDGNFAETIAARRNQLKKLVRPNIGDL